MDLRNKQLRIQITTAIIAKMIFIIPARKTFFKKTKTQATTLVQTKKCQESKTSLKQKGREIRPDKVINKVISEFSWMCVLETSGTVFPNTDLLAGK